MLDRRRRPRPVYEPRRTLQAVGHRRPKSSRMKPAVAADMRGKPLRYSDLDLGHHHGLVGSNGQLPTRRFCRPESRFCLRLSPKTKPAACRFDFFSRSKKLKPAPASSLTDEMTENGRSRCFTLHIHWLAPLEEKNAVTSIFDPLVVRAQRRQYQHSVHCSNTTGSRRASLPGDSASR